MLLVFISYLIGLQALSTMFFLQFILIDKNQISFYIKIHILLLLRKEYKRFIFDLVLYNIF